MTTNLPALYSSLQIFLKSVSTFLWLFLANTIQWHTISNYWTSLCTTPPPTAQSNLFSKKLPCWSSTHVQTSCVTATKIIQERYEAARNLFSQLDNPPSGNATKAINQAAKTQLNDPNHTNPIPPAKMAPHNIAPLIHLTANPIDLPQGASVSDSNGLGSFTSLIATPHITVYVVCCILVAFAQHPLCLTKMLTRRLINKPITVGVSSVQQKHAPAMMMHLKRFRKMGLDLAFSCTMTTLARNLQVKQGSLMNKKTRNDGWEAEGEAAPKTVPQLMPIGTVKSHTVS
eukprot:jgi/Psemu1/1985/gm1.1985_g